MACNLAAAEGGGAVMDRNVDLVHVRLLRLYDRAVEVGREGVGLAGDVAGEALTRQVGLVGVGAAVIAEAIDSPVGEGGVSVGRGHAAEAESVVGHDLAVLVDLEIEGVKGRGNDAVLVRGHVLHEHLPVVRRAVGLGAVIAAAELVLGVKDLDGVVSVNQLERVDAAVGYLQHFAIDCGIIQSVALVRGEGDGDVLVLGGKNMACNLAAVEGGGAVMDRNVDLVHVRLLGGLALDLAGDGLSIAVVPSFASPNQREGLANFVGISMPARDLLVVGVKNLIIVRHDEANVLFATLLNIISADGSLQIEGLGIFRVRNIFIDALKDNGELAQVIFSRVAGHVGLGVGARLFAAFVFDFYFNLTLIVSVVRRKGRVIMAEGSRIGEDAIDHVVGAEGLGHINFCYAGSIQLASKTAGNCHCILVSYNILCVLIASHGYLVEQGYATIFGDCYFAVFRITHASNARRSILSTLYELLCNPVQLIADSYFYYSISRTWIPDFLQSQFVFRYRHTKAFFVNRTSESDASDLTDRNTRVLMIIQPIIINVINVIIAIAFPPTIVEVIGIGMLTANAIYLYGSYLNIAGSIGGAIFRIICVGNLILQGIVTVAGTVTHNVVSRSTTSRGFRAVNDPILVYPGCRREYISTAVSLCLPVDKILSTIVRICGHVGANALSVIDIDDVVQLPVRFLNGLEVEFYLVAISARRCIIERQPNYIISAYSTIHVIFPIELGSVEYDTFGMIVIVTISKRNGNSDTINFIRHNHAAIRSIN